MAASVGRGLPSTHLVAMTVCGTIAIESDPEAHAIVARVPSKAANEQMRAQTVR
jgi:hypothetical protein